ncbi:MAG: ATP-binding protein [Balneola sp.]
MPSILPFIIRIVAFATLLSLYYNSVLGFQPREIPFNWEKLEEDFLVRNYTIEDGLPVNSINKVITHPNGYLYITTFDGLVQYDGNRFITLNTANTSGFKSNRLVYAHLDGEENLWIMDVQANLYLFKNGVAKLFQDHIEQENVVVYLFQTDKEGTLWISTNIGLYKQKQGIDFELIRGTESLGRILGLDIHDQLGVTILTDNGVYRFNEEELVQKADLAKLPSVPSDIFRIESSEDGTLWLFGKNHKLFALDQYDDISSIAFPPNKSFNATDIIHEDSRFLLFRTDNGYYRLRKGGNILEETALIDPDLYFIPSLKSLTFDGKLVQTLSNRLFLNEQEILQIEPSITDVIIDREENMWLGTTSAGLYQISKKNMFNIGKTVSPLIKSTYSIIEDENQNIWFSGISSDLGIFRIKEPKLTQWSATTESIEEGHYNTLAIAKDNSILVGGSNGLQIFKNNRWAKKVDEIQNITSMHQKTEDTFWLGTFDDAYFLDTTSYSSFQEMFGTRLGRVNAIKELQNKEIAFLSSRLGIALVNNSMELSFIGEDEGLSSNQVRDIYESSNDTLWIVTEDFGLNRILRDEKGRVYKADVITTEDGLIDNSLHRIIEDSFGYFWLNSNKGIMRISKNELNSYIDKTLKELTVQSYSVEEGLDDPEGNGGVQNAGLLTSDGKLLFPNQEGIVYTRPEWHLSKQNLELEQPRVETLSFRDSLILLQGYSSFELPDAQRDFQIKFTLPTFSSPGKLVLEYKLEGINNTWQRVGSERLASFTNIKGGTYTFLMRGKLQGETRYTESSFSLSVPLVYYEQVWFKFLIGLGLVLIFMTSLRILLWRARKRERLLGDLVNKRTKELTERTWQLEQSKAKLQLSLEQIQHLDESKSRFFTNFTHELRTPLSLILSPLEDMMEGDEERKPGLDNRNLSLIKRNAERLKSLVNQLLDVSKLNAGKFPLTLVRTDITGLTKQCVSHFEYSMSKKAIEFSLISEPEQNYLYVDFAAWEHICTNLMSNALKFTPHGGKILVTISENKDHVNISFSDTGSGISETDMPFIFDSYYQGSSTQSKSGGTGIGLALVKGLVDRMKGSIHVDSEPGKGSTFNIHLQKGYAQFSPEDNILHESLNAIQMPSDTFMSDMDLSESHQNQTSQESILLVEDNEDFRDYLSSVIRPHYNVRVAKNGKEGLEILSSFQPDIILSDIMMPEMDGYEMMHTIRSMNELKHVPFIFLTAKDSVMDFEKGLNSGADIYLTKPIQKKLLLTQIKALLRRESALKQAPVIDEKGMKSAFITKVLEIIQRHLGNPDLNVKIIAEALSMSEATLYRKWKKESSETINQTITTLRLDEVLRLVQEENLNFSEASFAVGYSNLSYFSQAFKKKYGIPPQEYMKEL